MTKLSLDRAGDQLGRLQRRIARSVAERRGVTTSQRTRPGFDGIRSFRDLAVFISIGTCQEIVVKRYALLSTRKQRVRPLIGQPLAASGDATTIRL